MLIFCIQGGPSFLLDLSLVIVVADAVTIYSVYNSDVMYKRGRNLYKYLHKKTKKKPRLLFKNNAKRGRCPVIKNPSNGKV